MTIYVVTRAGFLDYERYQSVHLSAKSAEKAIRKKYPNARIESSFEGITTFICKDGAGAMFQMFVRKEEAT